LIKKKRKKEKEGSFYMKSSKQLLIDINGIVDE